MSDTAPWEDFKPAAPAPDSGAAPWEDFKPPTPRTGAAAIPTAAEAAGKPYTPPVTPVAAPVQPPSFTDKITGAVEAAVNAATGIVGGFVGGVAALPGSAASAASELQRGGIGGFKRENVANPMEVMDSVSQGVGGALKRAVSGPMDLRQEQTPDSEMGQQYTEKYVQPAMENLIAAAPLHGTMGPKGGTKPAMQAAGDVRRGVVAPVANAAADAATAGVGKVARKVLSVDPELAKVAQTAGDLKYPIDVRPDQVVQGAKFTKLAGQASSDVPLANSKTASNQVAYTKNLIDLLNPEESKAERLTPEVFDQAMTRSGQGIGDIMAKTDVPETTLRSGAESLRENAEKFATDNDKRILGNYIAELLGKADDNGVINGTALKELNSEIGTRARSEAGNDLGRRLNDLQDVIQDAVQEHVDPANAAPLKDFRRQYAYGKMVEPLVAKTIDGVVSPSALMARVTATKQGKHYMARSMGGPIGDLAKVGQLIKEPGSSGTAERSLVYGAIKDVGKTAAAAAGGYPLAAAYNTLGPKLTRAMVGKRAKKAAPAEPPAEPTTSLGAGPGTPPAGGSGPGPLGDLTPDWQTTPGAGGGAPRGGSEPGLVPAVGEKPNTRFVPDRKAETPSKRAGSEIPAVPGRPDLPDSMLTGRPKETAATERTNAAMQEPGAQEAMRQQEAAKKLPVGETKELTPEQWIAADKKWRADHKLGEEDAGRARGVAQALKHDGPAVEAAARQHENSPRAFDREIARINEEGQARENESKQAAGSSEGDAGAAAPVRESETQPKPASAVRAAEEQPGAERTGEAGAGRSGAEPASGQGRVDEFVKAEAARISDGADPGLVARNITDPEVRSRVLKESERGASPESDNQPGGVQQKAGEKGVPENDNPEEVFKEGQAAPVARKPVGSAGAMDMALRERFGDKFIQGLKDQGILKYAPEGKRPTTGATFRTGSANEAPSATLFYNALTAEELPGTLMHELGEHFGIVRLLGNDRYGTMLNDLKALRDTDEVKDAWASVKRRYTDRPGANIPEGGATFMREVAAHLVESHPDLPFVRRLVNEIRAFFYENFGTTMGNRVDASLIRGLAASALRKASTGDLPKMKTPVYFVPKTQPAAGPRAL